MAKKIKLDKLSNTQLATIFFKILTGKSPTQKQLDRVAKTIKKVVEETE